MGSFRAFTVVFWRIVCCSASSGGFSCTRTQCLHVRPCSRLMPAPSRSLAAVAHVAHSKDLYIPASGQWPRRPAFVRHVGTASSRCLLHAPRPSPRLALQVTCMAKKKGVRIIVTLECTESRAAGATPSRYCTQKVKGTATPARPLLSDTRLVDLVLTQRPWGGRTRVQNRRNTPERLELMKYNPSLRKYTLHREIK